MLNFLPSIAALAYTVTGFALYLRMFNYAACDVLRAGDRAGSLAYLTAKGLFVLFWPLFLVYGHVTARLHPDSVS